MENVTITFPLRVMQGDHITEAATGRIIYTFPHNWMFRNATDLELFMLRLARGHYTQVASNARA